MACVGLKPVEGLADCVGLVPVVFCPVLTAAGLVAEADGLVAAGLELDAVAAGRAEASDVPGLTSVWRSVSPVELILLALLATCSPLLAFLLLPLAMPPLLAFLY